jgi:RNA polymerase sigma factor (sigma-70 family)
MSPRLSELLLSSQSDERLVSLARLGHERAFVAIVERYRPELHALARRLCSDGRGEDVVQQTFLSAFAALRAGAEVKHLRGWLYQIVRNAANRSRAPVCLPLDGATASVETVEEVVQQRALAMSALAELARLPARQRQAMVGTALGGMARAEVASTMGLSEGAVRQLVHRARTTLRTAVTAITPWPLARWLAGVRPGFAPGAADMAAGAGAASSGSVAIKVGALLASGTLVTGVAAVDIHGSHSRAHRARPHAAAAGRVQAGGHRAPASVLAAVAPSIVPVGVSFEPVAARGSGVRGGSGAAGSARSTTRGPGGDGVRADRRGERHDANRRGQEHGEENRGQTGTDGNDGRTLASSGSESHSGASGGGDDGGRTGSDPGTDGGSGGFDGSGGGGSGSSPVATPATLSSTDDGGSGSRDGTDGGSSSSATATTSTTTTPTTSTTTTPITSTTSSPSSDGGGSDGGGTSGS